MKKIGIALTIFIFSVLPIFSATVDAEGLLNGFGKTPHFGMRVSYAENISDDATFTAAVDSPSLAMNKTQVDMRYLLKSLVSFYGGGIYRRQCEKNLCGVHGGLGIQKTAMKDGAPDGRRAYFELEAFWYVPIAAETDKRCWEAFGKIGWKKETFDTYFQYGFARLPNVDDKVASEHSLDFHVKMFSSATNIFAVADLGLAVDFSAHIDNAVKANAGLKLGWKNNQETEYAFGIQYSTRHPDTKFPVALSAGWKYLF